MRRFQTFDDPGNAALGAARVAALRDELRRHKLACDRELAHLRAVLENKPDKRTREKVLADIAFQERLRARITQVIPD